MSQHSTSPAKGPDVVVIGGGPAGSTASTLLAQHGCSVLGDSVELAHKRALYLEEAAHLTYRALVAGRLADLPDCPAAYSAALERGDTVSA